MKMKTDDDMRTFYYILVLRRMMMTSRYEECFVLPRMDG